jgi:hypothetical protein|tara:strand:+ start:381 stop:548 length:168 start_codon:yes stop_codon:yes gene_type:complete
MKTYQQDTRQNNTPEGTTKGNLNILYNGKNILIVEDKKTLTQYALTINFYKNLQP